MLFASWLKKLEQSFLPFRCILCHSSCKNSSVCNYCYAHLPWLKNACPQCANPLASENLLCAPCIQTPPPYDRIFALFDYQSPIDYCILNLKFSEKLFYAKWLGDLIAAAIQSHYPSQSFPEYLIPVPLHPKRLQERGYNQALEIAKPIAKKLHIPLIKHACKRMIATAAQANIPATKRRKNLKNAFLIEKNFSATHVAIIDDVVTTTSTVSELSKALKQSGVQKVDIWCCARTSLR